MEESFALGIDFGTNSARALLLNVSTGEEVGSAVCGYPGGEEGILLSSNEPHLARQHPGDYLTAIKETVSTVVQNARVKGVNPENIIGIGVDTTGSTPLPVDENMTALGVIKEFKYNLNAQAWLWKDHTASEEAREITDLAKKIRPEYLAKCGGAYSSEWFFSKILHCLRVDPDVFRAAYSWLELSDYIPAVLAGIQKTDQVKRNLCAAGHKAMYNRAWGGLPDADFLTELDPNLGRLRTRLYDSAYPSDTVAGYLSAAWSESLGLPEGIPVAVGALDAHLGAVGSGIDEGILVKIMGTSTCDIMVHPRDKKLADIPGVSGIADDSVIPGYYGIEAGQSAVGDIFNWFVSRVLNEKDAHRQLSEKAAKLKAGQNGLLALDWNNGNRNVLTDPNLSGLLVGQTLHTSSAEIYRALIEGTAFGARRIIEQIENYDVKIHKFINCGGIAEKNPLVMDIYANVMNRPMEIAGSPETVALGAAIMGAAAAFKNTGQRHSVREIQKRVCRVKDTVYHPRPAEAKTYEEMYRLYIDLHDAFGIKGQERPMYHIMKKLLNLKKVVK